MSEAEQKQWYRDRYDTVFLDDAWSVWHIRVWVNARESTGMGIEINANIVFKYAEKYGMDEIETLERVKDIERGVQHAAS